MKQYLLKLFFSCLLRRKLFVFNILILFLLPSCMFTGKWKQKLYLQSHDYKEFILHTLPQNYKIICGVQNVITKNNKLYIQLQFDSLLIGKNRFLNIEIPSDNKEKEFPLIYEANKKKDNGTLCYLYLISDASFYNNKEDEISKLFDYSDSTTTDFDSIKEFLPISDHQKTGDIVTMAYLNFSYSSASQFFITWQKDTNDNWLAKKEIYLTQAKRFIKWEKRKKVWYYAKHSFYVITFCTDIVTFPYQVIQLIKHAK